MPVIRRSKRKVKVYTPYGKPKILYLHGHGELRGDIAGCSFTVPHGIHVFIPWGPGVAVSEGLGDDVLNNEGTPINISLAWIDRPGQPAFTPNHEAERQHKFFYPMACPNYTLLPPNGLSDHSARENVFQTTVPITLREIIQQNSDEYDVFVWSNCTVLRTPTGQVIGGAMDDLGDD